MSRFERTDPFFMAPEDGTGAALSAAAETTSNAAEAIRQKVYPNMTVGLPALRDGISSQLEALPEGGTLIMGNAGGSASGKSFSSEGLVASMLGEDVSPKDIDGREVYETEDAQLIIIGMDDFYHAFNQLQAKFKQAGEPLSFDSPTALKMDEIESLLAQLSTGNVTELQLPIHDYKIEEEANREFRSHITLNPDKKKLVVLDGLFALHPELAEHLDVKVFVEADGHTRFLRRLMRDPMRLLTSSDDVAAFYLNNVVNKHEDHVQPQEKNADIVIRNNLTEGEIERLVPQTTQEKFRLLDPNQVSTIIHRIEQELGGNFRGRVDQTDNYCDLGGNHVDDQIVRLRTTDGRHTFSYKSHSNGDSRKLLQVPLNLNAADMLEFYSQFSALYGQHKIAITKQRKEYELGNGVLVCIDTVTADENELGTFIEVKSSLQDDPLTKIKAVTQTLTRDLELDTDLDPKTSYLALASQN